MKINECIPEDKYDLSALERARALGFPALNEVLPDLLEWLRDANWPVAQPTASVLADAGSEIVPHIKGILRGEDAVWKHWLINLLGENLKPAVFLDLKDEFIELASQPTRNDMIENVDAAARKLLAARLS